jgi:hypothetical protein
MGPPGPGSSQYGSRYSMSRTCGPRDIISLVIPRIGDNRLFIMKLYDQSLVEIIKDIMGVFISSKLWSQVHFLCS